MCKSGFHRFFTIENYVIHISVIVRLIHSVYTLYTKETVIQRIIYCKQVILLFTEHKTIQLISI